MEQNKRKNEELFKKFSIDSVVLLKNIFILYYILILLKVNIDFLQRMK